MLCSQADIEVLRQIDVTAEPDPTILALIRHAEGIIEGLTGRRFDPVTDDVWLTEDLEQSDGIVYLPHFPITALSMADPEGTPLVEGEAFRWASYGKVYKLGAGTGVYAWDWQYNVSPLGSFPWLPGTTITYTGGISDPDETPQDLRTLCAQIASSLFDAGASGGPGIQSESLGGWSVSYAQAADQLTKTQMTVIRRYSHRLPVIAY